MTEFECEEEGAFPHPLDCSKYHHCDAELEKEEYDCLYPLTGNQLDSIRRKAIDLVYLPTKHSRCQQMY